MGSSLLSSTVNSSHLGVPKLQSSGPGELLNGFCSCATSWEQPPGSKLDNHKNHVICYLLVLPIFQCLKLIILDFLFNFVFQGGRIHVTPSWAETEVLISCVLCTSLNLKIISLSSLFSLLFMILMNTSSVFYILLIPSIKYLP